MFQVGVTRLGLIYDSQEYRMVVSNREKGE
jgi:hypothetical protein